MVRGVGSSNTTNHCGGINFIELALDGRQNAQQSAGMLPTKGINEIFREDIGCHGFGVAISQEKQATGVSRVQPGEG